MTTQNTTKERVQLDTICSRDVQMLTDGNDSDRTDTDIEDENDHHVALDKATNKRRKEESEESDEDDNKEHKDHNNKDDNKDDDDDNDNDENNKDDDNTNKDDDNDNDENNKDDNNDENNNKDENNTEKNNTKNDDTNDVKGEQSGVPEQPSCDLHSRSLQKVSKPRAKRGPPTIYTILKKGFIVLEAALKKIDELLARKVAETPHLSVHDARKLIKLIQKYDFNKENKQNVLRDTVEFCKQCRCFTKKAKEEFNKVEAWSNIINNFDVCEVSSGTKRKATSPPPSPSSSTSKKQKVITSEQPSCDLHSREQSNDSSLEQVNGLWLIVSDDTGEEHKLPLYPHQYTQDIIYSLVKVTDKNLPLTKYLNMNDPNINHLHDALDGTNGKLPEVLLCTTLSHALDFASPTMARLNDVVTGERRV